MDEKSPMTNRGSDMVLRGRIGSVILFFLALALSCSSSRKKGTQEEDASKDEDEASVVTSTDSKIEEIRSDAEDFSDVDRSIDGAAEAQSDAKEEPSDGDASELPKTELNLCDGSDEIRLYVAPVGNYDERVSGNGSQTFFLNGKCEIYLRRYWWDPIHVRTLAAAELEQLKTELRVEEWPAIAGIYYLPVECHLYAEAFVVDYKIILGHDYCPGTGAAPEYTGDGPVPINGEPPIDILRIADTYRKEHYDEGSPFSGSVRYALFEDSRASTDDFYRGAEPWPIGDPAEIAITLPKQSVGYRFSDKIRVAEGEQAETLRELQRRFLAGEISDSYSPPSVMEGIPILQSDGTGYELFMRDATRYEDETGLLILP